MKRLGLCIYFIYSFFTVCHAQLPDHIVQLKNALTDRLADTTQMNTYLELSRYYNYKYPDTVLYYASPGLAMAKKFNDKKIVINFLACMGEAYNTKGQYPKALQVKLQALQEAEQLKDPYLIASCENFLGSLYIKSGDNQKSLIHYNKAKENQAYFRDYKKYIVGSIAQCYYNLNQLDTAYNFFEEAYLLDIKDQSHWTIPYYGLAAIFYKKGNYIRALEMYRAGNRVVNPFALDILNGDAGLAHVFQKINLPDSAITYASKVVVQGMKRPLYTAVLDASILLSDIYKSRREIDSAFKYQEIMLAAKDSLFSQEHVKQVENLTFNELQRQDQIEQAANKIRQEYRNSVKFYSLIAGIIVLILIASLLYRNSLHKQHSNVLLAKKNAEIEFQRNNLEATLKELQVTQKQLIQHEKMASLGELTAGIAHEIQNPLNFVNNFSEVNTELIEELKIEAQGDNKQQVIAIANDLKANEEKINYHGKRADAIVKGMLEHSRSGTSEKSLTDINKLVTENLALAQHSAKAKDNAFNVEVKTELAPSVDNVSVVSHDIGRVLLNLFNNAFWAISVKGQERDQFAHPALIVSTKQLADKIEIRIHDNGCGILPDVIDKIFQPFFTTKPAGSGTGLGLSLAYDIVKAHNGEIKVSSIPGEGSEFSIFLPC